MRKIGPCPDQPQGGKKSAASPILARAGNPIWVMAFWVSSVEQDEQRVAGHEFRESLKIFRRKILQSRIAMAERKHSRIVPDTFLSRSCTQRCRETAAVFIVGDPLLGQFVEPLLFGHQTRLSALAVLIGISFWMPSMGPVGLVLAVPLTLAIVVMGQHLPRLEFLRILLGNEPALEPHEHLYHQFLADEASLAAKEAEHWIGQHTFENYLDEIAIPTLRVAADDQKRGVLGREQFHELSETIAEYLQLVQETLVFCLHRRIPKSA